MPGQALTHKSTRAIKIEQLQEAFSTNLPPTLLPLEDMTDYDLLRTLLDDVFKVEGFGTRWKGFLFFCKISLWHFFEWLTQLSPLPSFELLLSSLEPFFEWPTQLSPLLSKTSQLSTILSKSARLSTFLSAQKRKFTLKSTFFSGFTFLSVFLIAQKTLKVRQNLFVQQLMLTSLLFFEKKMI